MQPRVYFGQCYLVLISLGCLQLVESGLQPKQQEQHNGSQRSPSNFSQSDSVSHHGPIGAEPRRKQQQQQQQTSRAHEEPSHKTATQRTLDDLSHRLDPPRPISDLQADGQHLPPAEGDTRVPFWNIAHMINSIEQINLALGAGANGIETDVSFDGSGRPVEAYHGFPCDCGRHCHFRETLVEFVRHVAHITNPPASSRLQLVLFDLKLKDLTSDKQLRTAGKELARILHEHLYNDYYQRSVGQKSRETPQQPPVRVVVSINHAKDLALVRAFIEHMRRNRLDFMSQQVGFDVGMNDNLTQISAMWDQLNGATSNIWQGDGLTNCANLVRGVERLKEAISVRNNQGHFRKVYYWTADILYQIRSVLRLGLDAVLTNQPQRVLQALQEPEFKNKYRLATPYDNPFEQYAIEPSAWQMKAPSLGETLETVHNIKQTSADYIKTLPDGIGAAIKKVHATIV